MKILQKSGRQSNMVRVYILDSTKTDGTALSTLVYNSTGLVIDIFADNSAAGGAGAYHYKSAATATIMDIGTSGSTCGAYVAPSAANCRFAPVDATNLPGWYEIQLLDSIFTAGVRLIQGEVRGVTACTPTPFEIQIEPPAEGIRFTLSASATTGGTVADNGFRAFGDIGGVVVVESGSFPGQPRTVSAWNKSTGVFTVNPVFDNDPGSVQVSYYPQAPSPTAAALLPSVAIGSLTAAALTQIQNAV